MRYAIDLSGRCVPNPSPFPLSPLEYATSGICGPVTVVSNLFRSSPITPLASEDFEKNSCAGSTRPTTIENYGNFCCVEGRAPAHPTHRRAGAPSGPIPKFWTPCGLRAHLLTIPSPFFNVSLVFFLFSHCAIVPVSPSTVTITTIATYDVLVGLSRMAFRWSSNDRRSLR
jgi:hypothetical protein